MRIIVNQEFVLYIPFKKFMFLINTIRYNPVATIEAIKPPPKESSLTNDKSIIARRAMASRNRIVKSHEAQVYLSLAPNIRPKINRNISAEIKRAEAFLLIRTSSI